MTDDRYELLESRVRSILLEDAPAGVPEGLRLRVQDVPRTIGWPPSREGGRAFVLRRWKGLAAAALVSVLAVAIIGPAVIMRLNSTLPGPTATDESRPVPPADAPTDDPNAPLVATGHVIDHNGRPAPAVTVELVLMPSQASRSSAKAGQPLKLVIVGWTTTGADGSFSLHLRPNDAIRSVAAENGGFVNFSVLACDRSQCGMWNFPLQLSVDGFTGLPDPMIIKLDPGAPIATSA